MDAANGRAHKDVQRLSSSAPPYRARRRSADFFATTVAALMAAATLARPVSADGCGSAALAACDCVAAVGGAGAGTEMTCIRVGLSSLPAPPQDAVRVEVKRNNVTTLVNGSLPPLARLAFLDLSWNEIGTVQPAAFAGLRALIELRLNNNRFSRLPDFVFKDLEQLQTLQLRENNIDDLRAVIFYNLRNLVSLDLSGNQLASLPSNVFVPLTGLQTLVLDNNILGALPDNLLVMQASLVTFSAASNRIAALPQTSFFVASPAVVTVDLSLNRLESVPYAFFAGTVSLATVRFDGAALTCDCAQNALRLWMDGASTARARSTWLAEPQASGTCAQPPALQGRYVINVSASSFVCTTTTASTPPPTPTTTTLIAATSDGRVPSVDVSGTSTVTSGGGAASTPAALTGGPLSDTIAIVLGSCIGVLALLVAVTLTLVLRRRRRARKGDAPGAAAAASPVEPGHGHSNGPTSSMPASGGGQHAGEVANKNTFSPPTRHVPLLAAAETPPLSLEHNPHAASAAAEAASRAASAAAAALARGRAAPPPTMNGLVPYTHVRRHRTGSSDQPDSGGGAHPAAVPPFYVDPGTPLSDSAPAALFFVQRHAPAYLSARGPRDDRRLLETAPPPVVRNGPSTSSLRAAKPSNLLAVVAGGARGWPGELPGLRASPAGVGGRFAELTIDGPASAAHAQVMVLPSQGSVDSGVHSLTPGGCYYADAAGTPSTHRSFSPLSSDAIFVPDSADPTRPPLLEPRRYKNDTFV